MTGSKVFISFTILSVSGEGKCYSNHISKINVSAVTLSLKIAPEYIWNLSRLRNASWHHIGGTLNKLNLTSQFDCS